jgi:hypothetical protein
LALCLGALIGCAHPPPARVIDPAHARVTCPPEPERSPIELDVRGAMDVPCVESEGGHWALVLAELSQAATTDEEGASTSRTTGTYSFSFVDGEGHTAASTPAPFERLVGDGWYRAMRVEPRAVFDVDGDGAPELFVWIGEIADETVPRGEVRVLSRRGGTIVPLDAAPGTPIDDVEDVDGDGRPDLVSCTPYCGSSPWGASPVPAGGPRNVFRSRPDGTFSSQDPVVIAALRAACARAPTTLVPSHPDESGYEEALTAVSCARLRGESTDAVVTRLRTEAARCTDAGWARCDDLLDELVRHASLVPAHDLR